MRRIGTSDLEVVPLCLGGNVFGWTADRSTSEAILDAFVEGGGNFVDTADAYSQWVPGNVGGESEEIIGRWMHRRGTRDRIVLATKVGKRADLSGLAARTVETGLEASLQRLGTDHVDLYWAHADDPTTPLLETVAAFDALIRQGKVRAWGLSNYSAARIGEVLAVADANSLARPVALQPPYNLMERTTYERELAPVAAEENLAGIPYYGLASGFLTGKYARSGEPVEGARSGGVDRYRTEAGWRVIDALDVVANQHGVAVGTVALAWLAARPTVVAPIASASRVEQVRDLLEATRLVLSSDQVADLDRASAP